MAFCYPAEAHERTILIDIFGPDVHEVDFYDAETGRGRWAHFEGYDKHGKSLGQITGTRTKAGRELRTLASERGHTVRFTLLTYPD